MSATTASPAAACPAPPPPQLDSRQLFGAAKEVLIHHAGQIYRLRHTLNGKLILTK
jgi:hemin uptake protein HemP